MRVRKRPAGASGGPGNGTGRTRRALSSICIVPQNDLICQARHLDQAAIYLDNAQALLDDTDPRALVWAAYLLALAQAALALDLLEVLE